MPDDTASTISAIADAITALAALSAIFIGSYLWKRQKRDEWEIMTIHHLLKCIYDSLELLGDMTIYLATVNRKILIPMMENATRQTQAEELHHLDRTSQFEKANTTTIPELVATAHTASIIWGSKTDDADRVRSAILTSAATVHVLLTMQDITRAMMRANETRELPDAILDERATKAHEEVNDCLSDTEIVKETLEHIRELAKERLNRIYRLPRIDKWIAYHRKWWKENDPRYVPESESLTTKHPRTPLCLS